MIDVDRVVSWAEEKLGLKSVGTYEDQEGRVALADALLELRVDTPNTTSKQVVTTVEDQSEYDLPDNLGVVSVISWPWDDFEVLPVTYDFIREVRRQISNGEDDYSTAQPTLYSVHRQQGKNKLVLERSSGIEAGLEITVHYYPENYDEPNAGGEVDLPNSLELALKYGTAWHLAEQYAPDRIQYFAVMFDKYKTMYWRRRTFPSLEQYIRPSFDF